MKMRALIGPKIDELNKTAAGRRVIRQAQRNAHITKEYAGKRFKARGGDADFEENIQKLLEEVELRKAEAAKSRETEAAAVS